MPPGPGTTHFVYAHCLQPRHKQNVWCQVPGASAHPQMEPPAQPPTSTTSTEIQTGVTITPIHHHQHNAINLHEAVHW
ncbi:hypothetical protein GDO86_020588 [Hymenochirus boettgeri]|uniref:Uncharacterized protein n=1 Tax=Hymenochirus boettgeri TaxID=247094 RepID=A0A8T2II56_9PIPI|nr:hypothetical protein GDO86_020588 [Hymenochirus boettgeri]